jgi:predicted transcriptional regulator
MEREGLLPLVAQIVSAHVAANDVGADQLPGMIADVHRVLAEIAPKAAMLRGRATPDKLTCLECGMKLKVLTRHLLSAHGLDADAYRAKHGLPADDPMVAANYSNLRSDLAKASGLGRRR